MDNFLQPAMCQTAPGPVPRERGIGRLPGLLAGDVYSDSLLLFLSRREECKEGKIDCGKFAPTILWSSVLGVGLAPSCVRAPAAVGEMDWSHRLEIGYA